MGRVDNGADAFARDIGGQTVGAAEAADALWEEGWGRIGGRARKRQGRRNIGLICDPSRERARFRRAAENEQAKARQWAAP